MRTGFILIFTVGLSWSSTGYSERLPVDDGGRYLQVDVRDNRFTLEARDVSVEGALSALAGGAGIRLQIRGDFGGRRGSWSFRELSLNDAVRRIVDTDGWVLETDSGAADRQLTARLLVVATPSQPGFVSEPHPYAMRGGHLQSDCLEPRQAIPGKKASAHPDETKSTPKGLAEALRKGSRYDVRSVIAALETEGTDAATQELVSGLAAKDSVVRTEIVQALGRIGTDEAIQVLGQEIYGDPDPAVRKQAMEVLAGMPNDLAQLFLERPRAIGNGSDAPAHPVRCIAQ